MTSIHTIDMQGSAKQISWAQDIRAAVIDTHGQTITAMINQITANAAKMPASGKEFAECFVAALGQVMDTPDAGWWIDEREQLTSGYPWVIVARRMLQITPDMKTHEGQPMTENMLNHTLNAGARIATR